MQDKNILLIITGGIAAYKSLELIRLIKKEKGRVNCILTKAGEQFITPLSISSLAETPAYTDLWSLKDETEMGHIRLSREANLIVIVPASADIMAKMAHGLANDLASTTLLAADKHIMIAPAMNPQMWNNPATQANIKTLQARSDITILPPAEGEMACGETGTGRMREAAEIFDHIQQFFFDRPLKGKTALVTAGPTFEAIDPVRFIGNRSSGKQGYAIAEALHQAGAQVTLISGPTALPAPAGINITRVESAKEMHKAALTALPADIAICTAAVSDWTPATPSTQKIKKGADKTPPTIKLTENPDILHAIATHKSRPNIVIGFAAETNDTLENTAKKLKTKGCDWIIANDVSGQKVFGTDENQIFLITANHTEEWPRMSKHAVASHLIEKIIDFYKSDAK
jgi:phosphopantothenoylcysteine decarboxylase/phosphopantothenate--cysteine ligase